MFKPSDINFGFSFNYNGEPFGKCVKNIEKVTNSETEYDLVYTLCDGLEITQKVTYYEKYNAVHWMLWFENKSGNDTEIISELYDCNVSYPFYSGFVNKKPGYMYSGEGIPNVFRTIGSNWVKDEYTSYPEELMPNSERRYSCTGGRSSQGLAPYFDLNDGDCGILTAIGWTGQWNALYTSGGDEIKIRTGIEGVSFKLYPNEKIRTSSVILLEYSGGQNNAHIAFRRLIKNHYSLIGTPGRPGDGPLCTGAWGGITTETMLRRLDQLHELDLGFETYWIDAGWYGYSSGDCPNEFTGDWGAHTGSWNVNPNYHPDGMLDVAKKIKDVGMKFLLWLEPERVLRGTDTPTAHPDWFLETSADNGNLLLNLGNPDAVQGTFDMLAGMVERFDLACYRQDFNMDPLHYWNVNDTDDRKGITQIKHIMGLYEVWDRLLEKFPHLYIDNCASGGRRNDFEMMSRSIPLWRSDYQCSWDYDPETSQNHNGGISWWLPYSGTGTGEQMGDQYRTRSSFAPAITTQYWQYSNQSDPKDSPFLDDVRKQFAEYKKVRPYTTCDFYPLTAPNTSDAVWCAWQYNRPEENDGIILTFRRTKSPYRTSEFVLGGLDETAVYTFEDADTGEITEHSGVAFTVTIDEPRSSKLYFYKKKETRF